MRSKICRPKVLPPLFPHIWWSLLASTFLFVYLCQCPLWTDKLSSRAADTMSWYQISLFNRNQWGGLLSDHPSGKRCVWTNNLENVLAGVGSVITCSFKVDSHTDITVMWSPPLAPATPTPQVEAKSQVFNTFSLVCFLQRRLTSFFKRSLFCLLFSL